MLGQSQKTVRVQIHSTWRRESLRVPEQGRQEPKSLTSLINDLNELVEHSLKGEGRVGNPACPLFAQDSVQAVQAPRSEIQLDICGRARKIPLDG